MRTDYDQWQEVQTYLDLNDLNSTLSTWGEREREREK